MSWRKTIQTIKPESSKSWRDSISTVEDSPSELESGIRGLTQGASFGFADEATGALESLKDIALTDKELSDYQDLYKQNRDESRAAYKKAEEANPLSYMAGSIGGAVGTAFIPGLGVLNAAKGAGLATKAGLAAAQGGIAGLGISNEESVEGLAKDAAIGGALGAGMTVVGEKVVSPLLNKGAKYIPKVAGKVDEAIDWMTKKTGKGVFGVDEKATENYLRNPEAVKKAYSLGELADAVLDKTDESSALNEMKKKASELSTEAWSTLSDKRGISKSDILRAIDEGQQGLLVDGNLIGKSQTRAYNELQNLANQLKNMSDNIPESSMKKIIQNLDDNINWNNPEMGPTNDAIKSLRTFVDLKLKGQNEAYKQAMGKTEDVSKSLQHVKSVFENRQNPENYDKFNKAVKNLINKDDYSAANKAVDKIKEHTGYDLKKDIVDSWTKAQFSKGDVNGSRKTLLGGMIGTAGGTAVGNPLLGGAIGSSVGYTADRYAGPIFKKMLDGKITAQEFGKTLAPKLGKYSAPLMAAAQRGNKALAATHFVMMQRDPQYRKTIEQLDSEEEK